MTVVFADTSFFVAFLNGRDRAHRPAREYANDRSLSIVTSEWVLVEVANFFACSDLRRLVPSFLGELRANPRIAIVWEHADLFDRGLRLYEERPDKHWSLTDCVSFAIMEDRQIREALTMDHHFRQAGFETLLDR